MVTLFTPSSDYGTIIPNLKINGLDAPYGVVNDRAVRAGAGLMLMIGIFAFTQAFFLGNRIPLQLTVLFFLLDFTLKVFIGPKASPVSFIANGIVKKQQPEYVGAIQKRFAWSIGFIMALSMTILIVVLQIPGNYPLYFCSICLLFMYLETSFGICVGCKIYWGLISVGVIKEPEIRPACSGGVCPIPKKIKSKDLN